MSRSSRPTLQKRPMRFHCAPAPGLQLDHSDFQMQVETEATLAILERYDSGTNGKSAFPMIADPANVELNRLQLRYKPSNSFAATIGRQRIALDDQRFVGSAFWRQNEQTFDALRFELGDPKKFKVDANYAWSVRTIWGIDGAGARPTSVSADNILITTSYQSPIGNIGAFAFLVDQDEAAVAGFRLSNQTYGARLSGSKKLSHDTGLSYQASYARQSDWLLIIVRTFSRTNWV